jgi:cytochrome P450
VAVHYNPYDPATHADPYPVYAQLRAEAPVYRNDELDFWALSRHADVAAGYLDHTRFSNVNGNTIEPASWGPNAWRYASVLGMDPPRHTNVRMPVYRALNQRLSTLEPAVRELVRGRLDAVLPAGGFDFVTDFAATFPIDVMMLVIGIPAGDRELIRRLADAVVTREEASHDVPIVALEATLELVEYYTDLVARRRRERGDDLVSRVLDDMDSGGGITEEELVAFLNLLTAAANDTIIQLLGQAWYWASRYPRQREIAFAGEIGGWIEETLRFDNPNQFAARTAAVDIELHDTVIPAGGRVLLLTGSANRDAAVFPDSDDYDLRRNTANKLSFGNGRHFCLGARLTRLEARVALEELVARVAGYEIDEPGARMVVMAEARGFAALPTWVRLR